MSNKKIAIIDLGTNTFNLLVVEIFNEKINRLFSTKTGVALGMGGINKNQISDDALLRAFDTLKNYKDIALSYQASEIFAFGTSAMRNASNAKDLVQQAKEKLNIQIEIITGAREAELIYKGVTSGYLIKYPTLIMDIGGGSTEFIYANETGIIKAKSFEIGVSRMFQLFECNDPFSENDCLKINAYLNEATGAFFDDIKTSQLIGASGSFETFYKIGYHKDFPDKDYIKLPIEIAIQSLNDIIKSTQAERDLNPLIIPIRKKMAPFAAVKTKWLIEKMKITDIVISPFALKEGVMIEKMNG